MNFRVIPRTANLVDEVAALLTDPSRDYSAFGVVFQGKRPAHFLRKAIAAREGKTFLPPRVYSIDHFVEHVSTDLLGSREQELQNMDAAALLFEIHLSMDRRLGGGHFTELDAFLPLAEKLYAALEELRIAGITPAALAGVPHPSGLENPQVLAQFYEQFYEKVRTLGLCTRATRYAEVARRIGQADFSAFNSLIIAGFYGFTGAERVIVRALASLHNTVFLFQDGPGIGGQMALAGFKGVPQVESLPQPSVSFYRTSDTHGEVFGLARKLEEAVKEGASLDERTVIVLPSPDALFPVVNWTLPLLEKEYNISLGYPGKRTPVYGFLNALMQLISSRAAGKFYAPEYIRLVLHPYTKNIRWGSRSDTTRVMFHAIEAKLVRDKTMTFFSLEDIERDSEVPAAVIKSIGDAGITAQDVRDHLCEIHQHVIRPLLSAETLGDFARKAIEILTYVSDESTANRHQLFRPFALALMEQLDVLQHSRLGSYTMEEPGRYCSILRTWLDRTEVPFQGTPVRGVQVLGFLETRNLKFDRVFFLDANEDVIPGSADVDLLLPPGVRTALGLPGRKEREAIAAYYFDILVRGAQEAHIFFREGKKKEKSRFVEQLLWERQREEKETNDEKYIQSVSYDVELVNKLPHAEAKTKEMLRTLKNTAFSATALDSYLACQLRFFYAHVLGLREKEEVDGEIDRANIGRFVHKVLAAFYQQHTGRQMLPQEVDPEAIDEVVDNVFEEYFGGEASGPRYVVREQVKRQLKRYTAEYKKTVLGVQTVELVGVEQRLGIEWEGFRLIGFADRIERRNGKVHILDFKTGSNESRFAIRFAKLEPEHRETWEDAIGSLQLPFYALLYSGMSGIAAADIVPAYVMLGRNDRDESFEVPLHKEDDDVELKLEKIRHVLSGLLNEIMDPDQSFNPPRDVEKTCPHCPFTRICGTQWVKAQPD